MPNYRFVLSVGGDRPGQVEELGIFNDEGALLYARRLSSNRPVEVWEQARLVGRVDPRAEAPLAIMPEPVA